MQGSRWVSRAIEGGGWVSCCFSALLSADKPLHPLRDARVLPIFVEGENGRYIVGVGRVLRKLPCDEVNAADLSMRSGAPPEHVPPSSRFQPQDPLLRVGGEPVEAQSGPVSPVAPVFTEVHAARHL